MYRRIALMLPVVLLLSAGVVRAGQDDKRVDRAQRKWHSLETRAKKFSLPSNAAEPAGFLEAETRRLLDKTRSFPPASYEFDRHLEAIDDLLDAREDLHAAGRDEAGNRKEEATRDDTAKRLERAYFRVQQGDYFARLSAEKHASHYVPLARQLYQRARLAYDGREYRRANRLASASSELVNVLENLAQAAVRKPEPPVLK
jgi:hypothetical protein